MTVPVLVGAAASANIVRVHQLMVELRQRVSESITTELGDRVESITDMLDLGSTEAELTETDQRIDELVFQLYGIHSRDEIQVIERILR